jgi:hypothetical protein
VEVKNAFYQWYSGLALTAVTLLYAAFGMISKQSHNPEFCIVIPIKQSIFIIL